MLVTIKTKLIRERKMEAQSAPDSREPQVSKWYGSKTGNMVNDVVGGATDYVSPPCPRRMLGRNASGHGGLLSKAFPRPCV